MCHDSVEKKREHACVCASRCFPHNSVSAHGFICLDNICNEAQRWDSELSILHPKCKCFEGSLKSNVLGGRLSAC